MRTDGAVPVFLVIRARKNPDHWIFPKGHIEPGETAEHAALRELREEAGVEGELIGRMGTSAFRSGAEDVEVTYYLVRWLREPDAGEGRERRWLPHEDARAQLSFENARRLLDTAAGEVATR